MPETQSNPSAGARKIAMELLARDRYDCTLDNLEKQECFLCGEDRQYIAKTAALVDAALEPLRKAAHAIAADPQHPYSLESILARELAPWEPESGGGEKGENDGNENHT